ncbi:MAG: hypothetical protein QW518_09650, partial [Thermofilaceae archaeon]
RNMMPDLGVSHLATARAKLAELRVDGTLERLEAEIRSQIRWEEWKPGMKAPTGILWEDAYPELKTDPKRKAYIVHMPGTVFFETTHYVTREPLYTSEEVKASAEALIAEKVREILESRVAEEILNRW